MFSARSLTRERNTTSSIKTGNKASSSAKRTTSTLSRLKMGKNWKKGFIKETNYLYSVISFLKESLAVSSDSFSIWLGTAIPIPPVDFHCIHKPLSQKLTTTVKTNSLMVMGNLFVLTAIELRHLSIHFLDDFLEIAEEKREVKKISAQPIEAKSSMPLFLWAERVCVCVCCVIVSCPPLLSIIFQFRCSAVLKLGRRSHQPAPRVEVHHRLHNRLLLDWNKPALSLILLTHSMPF